MAGQFVGVSGVARKAKGQYVGVSGVARKVKNGFVGVNNVARKCFSSGPVTLSATGVKPDANGFISFSEEVQNYATVTGWIQIEGAHIDISTSEKIGEAEIWTDAEIPIEGASIGGTSDSVSIGFGTPYNACTYSWVGNVNGSSKNDECIEMSFSTDGFRIWATGTVNYQGQDITWDDYIKNGKVNYEITIAE